MSQTTPPALPTGLLDQFGQPLARADSRVFGKPQTDVLDDAQRSLTGGTSFGRRYSQGQSQADGAQGLTPARLESALRRGADGDLAAQAQVFSGMEDRDAHLHAEMSKRRRALLTVDWQITPPKGAGTRAGKTVVAAAQALLEHLPDFEDLILDLMDAVGHGFSAVQLQWDYNGSEQYIKAAQHKPQALFKLRQDCPPPAVRTDLRLIDHGISRSDGGLLGDGAALWPFGWAVHIHRAKSGFLGCAGLYRTLAWPYIFKHFSTKDFAEFLEVYGLPIKVGTYPNGSTDQQKREYLRDLLRLGHNAAGVFPEGMALDFKDAVGGQPTGFLSMMEYMDKAISKAILGQTLTSGGEGGGSYALGAVHREVQHDILLSDAKQLQGTITRDIIYPLLAANGYITNMAQCPAFEFVIEQAKDLTGLADALPKLANAGVPVPVSWVLKTFNIPEATEGEAVLEKSAAPMGFGGRGFGGGDDTSAASAQMNKQMSGLSLANALDGLPLQTALQAAKPADDAQAMAQALQAQSAQAMGVMMDQVRAVVFNAASLDDMQNDLLRLFGSLDTSALNDLMALGFATANLRGRMAVKTEAGV